MRRRYRRTRPNEITPAPPVSDQTVPTPFQVRGRGGGPPPVELGSTKDERYGLVVVGPWPSDYRPLGSDDQDMEQPGEKEHVMRHLRPTTVSKRNIWRTPSAR